MQYRIPSQTLQDIRERTNIVEVVGRYVTLKKRGHSYLGLCPFHSEKTPSFHVDEVKRVFYCFGCQTGGDVFKFLLTIEGDHFLDIVKDLAAKAQVTLPERELSYDERVAMDERSRLFALNESAAAFYEQSLDAALAGKARSYLEHRHLSSSTRSAFRVGFAPDGWHNLLEHFKRSRQSLELAEKVGLLISGNNGPYDRFRDRVMFPIRDIAGKVIAFGGRILDVGEPKYLNSPETPLFNKSDALYGLDLARRAIAQEESVLVVEGYFDVLGLYSGGIHNVVATCGTSLTRGHLRTLKRYTRNVVLVYDGDQAGQKAAARSLQLFLEEELWPSFIRLPAGKDPDEVIQEDGSDSFRERIRSAVPLLDHLIVERAAASTKSSEGLASSLESLSPAIAHLKPERADFYASFIARNFAIQESTALQYVRDVLRTEGSKTVGSRDGATSLRQPPDLPPPSPLPPHEELLIRWIFHDPASILPDARQEKLDEWVLHPEVRDLIIRALEQFEHFNALKVPELLDATSDEGFRRRLAELALRPLDFDVRSHDPAAPDRTLGQFLMGIKQKRIESEIKRLHAEMARAEQRGSSFKELQAMTSKIVELNRHKVQLKQQRSGSEK